MKSRRNRRCHAGERRPRELFFCNLELVRLEWKKDYQAGNGQNHPKSSFKRALQCPKWLQMACKRPGAAAEAGHLQGAGGLSAARPLRRQDGAERRHAGWAEPRPARRGLREPRPRRQGLPVAADQALRVLIRPGPTGILSRLGPFLDHLQPFSSIFQGFRRLFWRFRSIFARLHLGVSGPHCLSKATTCCLSCSSDDITCHMR